MKYPLTTQCCIQLAQGKLSTDQLTPEVLNLMSTHSPRHLSDLSLSFADGGDTRPSVEILRMMQKLSDRAIYAQDCCSCIRTCFKIAVVRCWWLNRGTLCILFVFFHGIGIYSVFYFSFSHKIGLYFLLYSSFPPWNRDVLSILCGFFPME